MHSSQRPASSGPVTATDSLTSAGAMKIDRYRRACAATRMLATMTPKSRAKAVAGR